MLIWSGVPDLDAYQNYTRGLHRKRKKDLVKGKDEEESHFVTRADLLNFMNDIALPETYSEMIDMKTYAVHYIASCWDQFTEPDDHYTMGVPLVCKQNVDWIGQLIMCQHAWALHGDGKHKIHIGKFVLMTFGTHCLKWDKDGKRYRHSFRPLIYLFSKEIESISSVRMAMVALQMVCIEDT